MNYKDIRSEILALILRVLQLLGYEELGILSAPVAALNTPPASPANATSPRQAVLSPIEEIKLWWDDADLRVYLKISESTIKRRRKDGTFKPFKLGRRYYYYAPDILDLRYRFMK